ncbi:MFS transporter (plasmid) [Streptomyces sp. BI20]|uniref:MFS transporter n=1 Tax=Streptomyces sp. BI20 TaxID=3403460 RepID=UPI003C715BB4
MTSTAPTPSEPHREAPAGREPGRKPALFVLLYAVALIGAWIAIMAPPTVSLALRVAEIDPAGKVASLSLVAGVGALFAIIGNPLFGKLSDRTTSRFGMRRPWMIAGMLAGGLGLLLIAVADNIALVMVGWCVAQLMFNALLAATYGVLPDQFPVSQRGTVSGIMGMCLPLGTMAATWIVQLTPGSTFWMLMLPVLVGAALMVPFLIALKDRRLSPAGRPPYSVREFATSFWVNPRRHRDYSWAWLSRFLLWMAVATFQTYMAYYLSDHLGIAENEVANKVFIANLVNNIALMAVIVPSGWLSDRVGRRKPFVLAGAVAMAAGMGLLVTTSSWAPFLIGCALTGVGMGVYFSVDIAIISEVLPNPDDAAKDLGVMNIACTLPYSVVPAIAPLFLALGGAGDNYPALFVVGAVLGLLGIPAIRRISKR